MNNFSQDIQADIIDNLLQYKLIGRGYSVMIFTQIINIVFETVWRNTF